MDPLEVLELPMGIINYYYFQAWTKNQEAEQARIEEEKKRAAEDKNTKIKSKIHPAQGGKPFSLSPDVLEDLQDELI